MTSQAVIGVDESGKGDYFGPLVVAGVAATHDQEESLRRTGIRDSKTIADGRIMALAETIQTTCPCMVVAIGPDRYNELYASFKNLNHLLAWGHARVIENLLARVPCERVIADQFADKRVLDRALMEKGRQIELIQKPRAEKEISVAAASIVARAEFLGRLEALSRRYAVSLPKGAGPQVISTARTFVQKHGPDALGQVAKLHFRTTGQILAKNNASSQST